MLNISFFILIALFSNLSLGIIIFKNNPNSKAHRYFFIFTVLLSIWILSNFLISILNKPSYIKFIGKIAFASGILSPATLCIFFFNFPKKEIFSNYSYLQIIFFLPAFLLSILCFSELIQKDIYFENNMFRPVYGPLFPMWSLFTLFYILICLFLPLRNYIKTSDFVEKNQLKYTLFGIYLSSFIIIFAQIIIPFITNKRYFFGLAPSSTTLMVLFISYSIIRYRFMNILVAFRAVIIYSILVIIISSMLILFWFGLQFIFINYKTKDSSYAIYSSILFSLLISIIIQPLKNLIEKYVDKYFFKGRYNYQKALILASNKLTSLLDLKTLRNFLSCFLIETMAITKADIILFNESKNFNASTKERKITEKDYKKLFMKYKNILIKEELKIFLEKNEYSKINYIFDQLDCEIIIPLIYQKKPFGFISIGKKISSDIFSPDDIDFILTLANQLTVAIQNALLYNQILEIKTYNENILQQMTNGVISINNNLEIVTYNNKASEIIGLSPRQVLGNHINKIPKEISHILLDVIHSKMQYENYEVYVPSKSGYPIPINVSSTLLKDDSGKIIGALALFTDLTEIKKLQYEIHRAERLAAIGTLAAGMAHEIKNPLVTLKTFYELLPFRYNDIEFRNTFSNIARQEVDRINNLVEQLLKFAKPSKPSFSPINVCEIIDQTVSLLDNELSRCKIILKKDYKVEPLFIFADPEQIKQVLLNIFMNSIHALLKSNSAKIIVRTEIYKRNYNNCPFSSLPRGYIYLSNEAVISIKDNGKGIPSNLIEKIFDPFFSTKEKGYGLGLSIAYNIVNDHKGKIQINSVKNKGTTVTLFFPAIHSNKNHLKRSFDEVRISSLE